MKGDKNFQIPDEKVHDGTQKYEVSLIGDGLIQKTWCRFHAGEEGLWKPDKGLTMEKKVLKK